MRIALIEDNVAYKYELKKLLSVYGPVSTFDYHDQFFVAVKSSKLDSPRFNVVVCDRYTGSDALDFMGRDLADLIRENVDYPIFIILISASFLKEKNIANFDLVVKKNKSGYLDLCRYVESIL